jgi:predicted acylesterase/phospholipase RssA
MKRVSLGIFIAACIVCIYLLMTHKAAPVAIHNNHLPSSGTAIIMTGAAARIPQQAAMLEEMYDRGMLNDVEFISGVSAGALNAVMLNGILSGKITWDEYRNILFNLKNTDIFLLQENNKLPVNTEPKYRLFKEIVEGRLGYLTIGDLPIMTEISFNRYISLGLGRNVYRMCSRKINAETDTTLRLVDILMATSAIPVAFPPVRIENVTTIPDARFTDGGVGADNIPFRALLEFQQFRGYNVSKVYILSRKASNYGMSEEFHHIGIERKMVIDRSGLPVDNVLKRLLVNRLGAYARAAPEMLPVSYVWIPDFEQNFLMFNFNNMKEQYMVTREWAKRNDPVPLEDFLLNNKFRRKKSGS